MEKIILVDGNNLMFRSYHATAYSGDIMRNSKGFPTNALFGFANMINKILLEENPSYILVAFDKGKTFRHELYDGYKDGRKSTPVELKEQMPIAKKLLEYMGIKYYECDNYEADDIIGTVCKICEKDKEFTGTIISSDRDLLQLISDEIDIKLLKQKDYIRYNKSSFIEKYGIEPIRIIDLKALQGDSSDNIPGVAGIGEKTAFKLLHEYKTLDEIYENIDNIKGKIKEKLVDGKKSAYFSYKLATIVTDVPLDFELKDLRYKKINNNDLIKLYQELEFNSLLKKELKNPNKSTEEIDYTIIQSADELELLEDSAVYLEILGTNYHKSEILGVSVYNEKQHIYIRPELLKDCIVKIEDKLKYTYDFKKLYSALHWQGIYLKKEIFDIMIAAYLVGYNVKDDIAELAQQLGVIMPAYHEIYGKESSKSKNPLTKREEKVIIKNSMQKAKFIYENYNYFKKKIEDEDMHDLFYNIEMPLSKVIANMELDGVNIDKDTIIKMKKEMNQQVERLEKEIFELAGHEFNLSSPVQLSTVLFEELKLPHGAKIKNGYSTASEVLEKIKNKHPIIEKIIEYRMITKICATYLDGLLNSILSDGKIHTIYTQTLTRTGRLSSIEPNLQNIPIRYEYGRLIRKAFIPSKNSVILGSDYSQIELRVMADVANIQSLIDAFKNDIDIHTKTASDIFKVKVEDVTSEQRRIAKAANFGIVYGISNYGLAENLGITTKEAKEFIENYFATYPGIREFQQNFIAEAYKNGYVTTVMKRKRYINELKNISKLVKATGERIAINTPIQGTSADIIKKSMVDIDKKFRELKIKSKMILQVHDELVFDTLIEEKDIVISIVKEAMENVLPMNVPLKVDINYGNNWYEAK